MMDLSAGAIGIDILARSATLFDGQGSFVDGLWVPAADAGRPIQAVIQAATQKDLVEFSDRDRLDGYVRIYTHEPLRTVDDESGDEAQVILTPEGERYRIVKAGRRSEGGFTRAIGRLMHDRGRSV